MIISLPPCRNGFADPTAPHDPHKTFVTQSFCKNKHRLQRRNGRASSPRGAGSDRSPDDVSQSTSFGGKETMMACGKCRGFHGLMSNYTSLALSIPRQAELFSCRNFGQLLEIGALALSFRSSSRLSRRATISPTAAGPLMTRPQTVSDRRSSWNRQFRSATLLAWHEGRSARLERQGGKAQPAFCGCRNIDDGGRTEASGIKAARGQAIARDWTVWRISGCKRPAIFPPCTDDGFHGYDGSRRR